MKVIPYLLVGNHPKAFKIKERIIQIIKTLKQNGGKLDAKQLEEKLGISRLERPAMFYKPLAALKKWDLVQVHKSVWFDDKGKKHFKTVYELTPEFFYRYLQKNLVEVCRTELEMT
jgi:predicted transcriptional regulator